MSKVKIINARLSYPSIFNKAVFDGKEGKYEATFLISKKDVKTKKEIDSAIAEVIQESKIKIPDDRYCIKDGDLSEYVGYADHWSLKAGSMHRPTVINRDKTPIVEDDGYIYAGCYVNAIVDFWVQDNRFGKRLNANLRGIQFVADGEHFGAGPVNVMDQFEELEEDYNDFL